MASGSESTVAVPSSCTHGPKNSSENMSSDTCGSRRTLRAFTAGYGLALLGLWAAGLVYVSRQGAFFRLPDDPSLLRNMVYFPKLRVEGAPEPGGKPEPLASAASAVKVEG